MPRFDVTTIGEGQLRYCVPAGLRMERVRQFDVHVSGTEANVTGLLSRLGWTCGWVSALPDTPLGQRVRNEYLLTGLDISAVKWVPEGRLATYYVEYATPPRPTRVFFDRKNTPFTQLTIDDIDWDYLLDTRLVHLSGLSVPLSPTIHGIILEAIKLAKSKGIAVSFDMNYRQNIWSAEEAAKTVKPIFNDINILFCSRGDALRMFSYQGSPEEIVQQLRELSSASHIIVSLSSDGLMGWDSTGFYHQPAREVGIVDRIGAGDAMVAGVLHGWLQGDFPKGIRYGALTAALALSQYGDQIMTTKDELKGLLNESTMCNGILR